MFTTGHGNHDSKNGVTFGVALLLAKKRGVQNLSNQAKRTEAIVFISTPVIRAGHGIATHLSWSVAIPCPLAGLARYTKTQVYRVANIPMNEYNSRPCAALVGTPGFPSTTLHQSRQTQEDPFSCFAACVVAFRIFMACMT